MNFKPAVMSAFQSHALFRPFGWRGRALEIVGNDIACTSILDYPAPHDWRIERRAFFPTLAQLLGPWEMVTRNEVDAELRAMDEEARLQSDAELKRIRGG